MKQCKAQPPKGPECPVDEATLAGDYLWRKLERQIAEATDE